MNDPGPANPFHRAVYLTGPTAVGKTAVGVELARQLGAEVVALDAFTLYRGMDIGTAKPDSEERGGIPHHLIDVLDPWEAASVADYRERATRAVDAIRARGRRALFVGGTALYLKVLLRGLFDGPAADPALRADLERHDDATLHARLAALDPASSAKIPPGNRRRVIRALEVAMLTGRPIAALQVEHDRPAPGVAVFALDRPRPEIHRRINLRVGSMFAAGLVEETQRLRTGPRPLHPVPAQGVGYREASDLLDGRSTLAVAIERTQARTRQLAKRQSTWFRGLAEVVPHPVESGEPPEVTARAIAGRIGEVGRVNNPDCCY